MVVFAWKVTSDIQTSDINYGRRISEVYVQYQFPSSVEQISSTYMDCDRRLGKRCHNSWNTSARFEQSVLNQVPVNFVKPVECLDFQITIVIITTKNCSLTGVYWCIRYSYGTIRGNAQLFSAHINRDVISCKYMTWHNIFNTKHSVSLAATYTYKKAKQMPQ